MAYLRLLSVLLAVLFIPACANQTAQPTVTPYRLARQATNTELNLRVDVVGTAAGSGVVISRSGHILTACHVACDSERLGIVLDEGGPYPFVYEAKLVATDKNWDLAVIKIDRKFRTTVKIADPRTVRAGQSVYSLGYPMDLGQITTRGTITRTNYTFDFEGERENLHKMLLIDLQTGPGHSGGPVFSSANGDLVGIMHAIVSYGRRRRVFLKYTLATPARKICSFLDAHEIPYDKRVP